ncbi:MAG: peroxiredoxin [Acidobacteria bacterium]|nr:peroxiredoxin [Acidobacteriota bacterium]
MIKIGAPVPDITCKNQDGHDVKLSDLRGKIVVIYFYPKDNTPGCTTEGQNFRDNYALFQNHNTEVIGVSRDSVASHKKFADKQCFPFPLWSDPQEEMCRAFDVIREKKLYGRTFMGIERSTFIIDPHGNLAKEYRKIKLKGHVEQMLNEVTELNAL